jgi:hypothetical protein
MNQKNSIDPKIEEQIEKIVYDEVSFSIITSLRFHESLNLKRIAQLIGKPETTTIRHLKQLLKNGLIDIDAEKTASSWGKFYCLSKQVKAYLKKEDEITRKRVEDFPKEFSKLKKMSETELQEFFAQEITEKDNFDNIALRVDYGINLNYNIQKMIINNFIEISKKLKKLKEEKDKEYLKKNLIIDPADINTTTLFIKYSKAKHIISFIERFAEFHIALEKLREEIQKEMDEEQVPEEERKLHYVDLFMGTTEFNYKLKDK